MSTKGNAETTKLGVIKAKVKITLQLRGKLRYFHDKSYHMND